MIPLEYAKAIYEIAEEEQKVELFNEYFVSINSTLNGEFIELLKAPTIDKSKKKKIVEDVYKSIDQTFVKFLVLLVENDRIDYFGQIAHQYRKLVRMSNNIVRIDIFSANELKKKQLDGLIQTLESKYKGKDSSVPPRDHSRG